DVSCLTHYVCSHLSTDISGYAHILRHIPDHTYLARPCPPSERSTADRSNAFRDWSASTCSSLFAQYSKPSSLQFSRHCYPGYIGANADLYPLWPPGGTGDCGISIGCPGCPGPGLLCLTGGQPEYSAHHRASAYCQVGAG